MRYSLIILITTLVALNACQSGLETIRTHDGEGNLLEQFEIDTETGKKEGLYERYREGYLVETAIYHQDTLHGIRTFLFPNGNKEIEETYEHGIYHGSFRSYYEDGQLKLEGLYQDGTMSGEWTKYYESGSVMEVVSMRDNQENGPFVEYYENGNLKAEGQYLDGDNEDGELKLYDEDGILEKRMLCEKGICQTVWQLEDNATE